MAEKIARHAPISVVENYLAKGLDGVLGIDGDPPGRIVIEATRGILALRFPARDRIPDVIAFRNLGFETVRDDGVSWHQMTVRLEDNVEEVYSLICAVLDRVQLSGESFADAVDEVLDSLSEILAVRRGLSREQQVGLFGELFALLALANEFGGSAALDAWRGPLGEEHDFGVKSADLEVKATLSEKRQHWISTVSQLAPTGNRPLYLVSIQLTTAATDAGCSLPSLIAEVRMADGLEVSRFDEMLNRVGYTQRDEDLYRSRWTPRSTPAFFLVDDVFPALTQARLDAVVPSAQRIVDVRYRVDLTAMKPSLSLFPFEGNLDRKGTK